MPSRLEHRGVYGISGYLLHSRGKGKERKGERGVADVFPSSSCFSTQIGYFSGALDLSEEVLPQLIGIPKNFLTGEMKRIEQTIKEWSVKRRANNPFARMLSPNNYKEGKDGVWEWCGKGTGSFLDGSLPYGE